MPADPPLHGHKRHIVVLSDVHLGTDAPTVWYQRELHQPYLLHLLQWVIAHADAVRELVLLGDIVDLWTYPADQRPPTFADIVACHPEVLGPDGVLAQVLDALDGAVTYVPGNHDLGVTPAEVARITSPGGHHIRLIEEVPYLPLGADDPSLALAHGHHDTLFNAPVTRGPWAPLPLGYFVTRAVATKWQRDLAPGQTVAELAGQGAPNGVDLASLGSVVSGVGARSVGATVVDFVSGVTGVGLDVAITMPDGTTATLADARVAYADTWGDWAVDHGGGIVGQSSAYRAAMADMDGSYLGWFAQRMALRHDNDLVVMGHTHVPVSGLDGSLVEYVNTGFDCPSGPDLSREVDPQRVTFAVIDTGASDADPLAASLWAVSQTDEGMAVATIDVPRSRISPGRLTDYSCYVIVDNDPGRADLELVDFGATDGTFVVPPPERVPVGTEGRFWLQDLLGAAGSSGWATYRQVDEPDPDEVIELRFSCPTLGTNRCTESLTFATRTDDGPWRDGRIAHWGHPFFVRFELR